MKIQLFMEYSRSKLVGYLSVSLHSATFFDMRCTIKVLLHIEHVHRDCIVIALLHPYASSNQIQIFRKERNLNMGR